MHDTILGRRPRGGAIRDPSPTPAIWFLVSVLLVWTGIGGCAWGWDDDDDAGDDDTGEDDDAGDDDAGDDDTGDDDTGDDDTGDDDTGDDDSVSVAAVLHESYFLDLSSFAITYPPGIGLALSPFLPRTHGAVFMTTQIDDQTGSCSILFGAGEDGEGDPDLDDWGQDLGQPTVSPPCSWSNPTLQAGPVPQFDLVVPGEVTANLINISFTGDFLPDGSGMVDVQLEGLLDLYSMDLWQEEPPGTACEYLEKFGFPCVPCPIGPHQGEVYCSDLVGESGILPQLPGMTMVVVPG